MKEQLQPTPETSILTYEFLTVQPEKVEIFDWQHPVNRASFASWLSTSFDVSRGQSLAQFAFMEWSRINLRFDYKKSIDNYEEAAQRMTLLAGSANQWDFFSESEKQLLISRFKGVKKHRDEEQDLVETSDSKLILSAIDVQVKIIFDADEFPEAVPGFIPPNMTSMDIPADQFKKKCKEYVDILRKEDQAQESMHHEEDLLDL